MRFVILKIVGYQRGREEAGYNFIRQFLPKGKKSLHCRLLGCIIKHGAIGCLFLPTGNAIVG